MTKEVSKKILTAIQAKDPDAFGSISVNQIDDTIFVSGQVRTNVLDEHDLESEIRSIVGDLGSNVIVSKLVARGLQVSSPDSFATTEDPSGELDEVEIVYYGLLEANKIISNDEFKKVNHETLVKVKRAIDVMGFVAPLVLDSNFKIIDGNLRLAAVRKLFGADTAKKIPVVVINDSGPRADFLRLVMNRSSEFQRWVYHEVDSYVDEWPQLQPVLEPLGFFANKILPNSFFGNTIFEYRLDEYNDQQQKYSQDLGLAAWAEMQRNKIKAAEEARKAERDRKKTPTSGLTSLFDLQPSEEDFLPTYDIEKELREHTLEQRAVAETITNNYDAIRKAEKERLGQDWQTSRRGSKQKANDKRAEAEALALAAVDDEVVVTDGELELDE